MKWKWRIMKNEQCWHDVVKKIIMNDNENEKRMIIIMKWKWRNNNENDNNNNEIMKEKWNEK